MLCGSVPGCKGCVLQAAKCRERPTAPLNGSRLVTLHRRLNRSPQDKGNRAGAEGPQEVVGASHICRLHEAGSGITESGRHIDTRLPSVATWMLLFRDQNKERYMIVQLRNSGIDPYIWPKHGRVSRRPGELPGRCRRYGWDRGNRGDSTTLTVLTWTIQPPLLLSLLPCFLFRLELAEGTQLLKNKVGCSIPVGIN